MAPVQDMEIIPARELKCGDVILDGMHKPFTERIVIDIRQPQPMLRDIRLEDEDASVFTRPYKIDDYVSIVPRAA